MSKKDPERDRVVAIMRDDAGHLFLIPAKSTQELRRRLQTYPKEDLVEVWKGERLELIKREDFARIEK